MVGKTGSGRRVYKASAEDYKLLEEVGYGANAVVYRAIYLPFNDIVAVKCLDLDRCNSNLVSPHLSLSLFLPPSQYCLFYLIL